MAISRHPLPLLLSSSSTAVVAASAVVVRRPLLPCAARRRPRYPPQSKSSTAIVVHRCRLSRSCIVSRGLKILSNMCLSPTIPLFDPEHQYPIPRVPLQQ